jgi:hypothetical protein
MVWVCLRSWSLKGDWRGPVCSLGVKALGKSFEGGLTGSFSELADEPVILWTRSLKVCVSACMKVVAVGDDGEVMVLCFTILERERERCYVF